MHGYCSESKLAGSEDTQLWRISRSTLKSAAGNKLAPAVASSATEIGNAREVDIAYETRVGRTGRREQEHRRCAHLTESALVENTDASAEPDALALIVCDEHQGPTKPSLQLEQVVM